MFSDCGPAPAHGGHIDALLALIQHDAQEVVVERLDLTPWPCRGRWDFKPKIRNASVDWSCEGLTAEGDAQLLGSRWRFVRNAWKFHGQSPARAD